MFDREDGERNQKDVRTVTDRIVSYVERGNASDKVLLIGLGIVLVICAFALSC